MWEEVSLMFDYSAILIGPLRKVLIHEVFCSAEYLD